MRRRDDGIIFGYINVDLGSNTKPALQVNTGLDGKRRSRYQTTRIARFQIIDVRTVSVAFFADRMTGSMEELVRVACFFDNAA
jgi:hypothetical protein